MVSMNILPTLLYGKQMLAYPAHDLGTSPALRNHIPSTFTNLPARYSPRIHRSLAEKSKHGFDAVRDGSTAVQHIRYCLDIFIFTTQGLLGQLLSVRYQVHVELTACPGESV